MPVEPSMNTFTPRPTSLFRPVTPSNLKDNMGDVFNRTKEFVGEQLDGVTNMNLTEKKNQLAGSEEENIPRLQPQGMGKFVDMFV